MLIPYRCLDSVVADKRRNFPNRFWFFILDVKKPSTNRWSFSKRIQGSEKKGHFQYEWFDTPNKIDKHQLPLYDDFYSKLKNCNPLDKDDDFQKLLITGYSEEQFLKKLNSGITTRMLFLPLVLCRKRLSFIMTKRIDMLKLGCTLPNLANMCLHKSNDYTFYPFFTQACIWDGTIMNKHKTSRLSKIDFKRSKIWSSHTFKQTDMNAKLRVTTLQEHKTKKIALVLMVIAIIVRLSLKQLVVFSILALSRS